MSSYVLTYSLITAKELIKLSIFFINNNFSFQNTLLYLSDRRRQYLFNKYSQELWSYVERSNCIELNQQKSNRLLLEHNMEVNEDTIFSDTDTDAEFINYSDIEIATGITEVDSSYNKTQFYDTVDPYLVFSNSNIGPVTEGVRFRISGVILYNCETFQINLVLDTPTNDIALHINPRLPQNYIVRNCRLKNYWGNEENSSHVPFTLKRGHRFSIQILVTKDEYLISIDDKHYACFRHRIPFNLVKCLEVKGGVDNIDCNITHVNEYPTYQIVDKHEPSSRRRDNASKRSLSLPKKYLITRSHGGRVNHFTYKIDDLHRKSEILQVKQQHYDDDGLKKGLSLPFYGALSENLINGKSLRFEGRIKILPHSFFINLQQGHSIWPHPIIAFHFNPRFAIAEGKHVICRNSWFDDKWQSEERSELNTDFTPGRSFTLIITCKEDRYEIYLNERLIVEYKYRTDPVIVDTVYVQGDLKLWEICLE